jgi:predicted dehydrogenase
VRGTADHITISQEDSMTNIATPLRVGVIGLGWAGQQHMAAYDALDNVELVAIAGMEAGPRAELATQFGVKRTHSDWRDLLTAGGLDAVSVAVPTFLHAPISIAALEAGIHVLCEKPIARDGTEAEAMVAAAQTSGRVLEIAFNHRRRGDIEALKAAVDAGAIGRPYHARANWMRRSGIPALGSWFTNREQAGGGPLIDLGVHVLDFALHLLGEPRVLAASCVTHAAFGPRGLGGSNYGSQIVDSAYEVEDFASVLLRLEGGGSLMLETSWAAHRPNGDEFGITIYGDDGGAELRVVDYAPVGELSLFGGSAEEPTDSTPAADEGRGHDAVVETFIEHVSNPGEWAAHNGALALGRARLIDACYASAELGAEVRIDANGAVVKPALEMSA